MRLADYLDRNDVSVADLAEAVGCSRQAIYRYASGARMPRRETLERLRQATNGAVTPNDFFDLPEPVDA